MSEQLITPRKVWDVPLKTLSAYLTNAQDVMGWARFGFALLQSVCTFFTALDGLRILIGVGALAFVTQAGIAWDHFHADLIRVPMFASLMVLIFGAGYFAVDTLISKWIKAAA